MTQPEGFCTLFFVFLCRASGSTPAYSPPDSSYAATLHALTTVRPEIPAISSFTQDLQLRSFVCTPGRHFDADNTWGKSKMEKKNNNVQMTETTTGQKNRQIIAN